MVLISMKTKGEEIMTTKIIEEVSMMTMSTKGMIENMHLTILPTVKEDQTMREKGMMKVDVMMKENAMMKETIHTEERKNQTTHNTKEETKVDMMNKEETK